MSAILTSYFGYPYGAVWSNLIASAICALAVWWRVRARMIAHHAEDLAQAAHHHREQMAQADQHHEEMGLRIRHVATASVAVPQALLDDIAKRRGGRGTVKGGAGSNPAKSEGLPADGPVVPPPAAPPGGGS